MDIDEIFKEIETKKENKKSIEKDKTKEKSIYEDKTKNKDRSKHGEKSNKTDTDDSKYVMNKESRKFIDGLPIYSLEELNIGQGGDTEDCPFECDCCY